MAPQETFRRSLQIYLFVLIGLWAAALATAAAQGALFHRAYPYNTLLFIRDVQFTDFTIFNPRFAVWNHATGAFFQLPGFPFTYPAPLLAAILAYTRLTPAPLAAYLTTVVAFAVIAAAAIVRKSGSLALVVPVTLLGSYPLLFLLDRANVEGLVWIAAALGIYAFAIRRYGFAAAFLGLAAAMKIFPAALLLLFFAKRRYREFVLSLAAGATATLVSLWIAGPSIPRAARGIASGMNYFRQTQILAYRGPEIGFEHSLFSCLKQPLHLFLHGAALESAIHALAVPYLIAAAMAFLAAYILILRHLPLLNQLFGLTAASVLLPFVSYDYTLTHMYIPFAAFLLFLAQDVAAGRAPFTLSEALAFLIPSAILFAPLSYLLWHSVGMGGQVKAFALLAILHAALTRPMPSSLFGELRYSALLSLNLRVQQPLSPNRLAPWRILSQRS